MREKDSGGDYVLSAILDRGFVCVRMCAPAFFPHSVTCSFCHAVEKKELLVATSASHALRTTAVNVSE